MIEIMVVLAIVGVLTAAIVGNYGSFRSATVATNMAFELAASVRQSQQYGLGVRLNGQPGTTDDDGNPNDTYGVEFTKGSAVYSIFRELDTPDGKCDAVGGCDCSAGATNECVEQIRMLQQVTVEGLCTGNAGMFPEDLLVDGDCGHESLSVLYTRPNPEAAIYTVSGLDVDASLAGVVIRGGDHCRLVRIYSNGQVAVGSISAADAGPIFASACGA